MELIALALGLIVVAMLVLQVPVLVYGTLQRSRAAQVQRRLDYKEWKLRLQASEAQLEKAASNQLSWSGWRKFEVRKKIVENKAGDICSFYFYPHDRKKLPAFNPGQFLMFRVDIPDPDNPGETIEETRCYSLSDSPNPRYYRISVRRVPGPRDQPDIPPGLVSGFLHEHINEGDLIDVQAPSGEFFLDPDLETPVALLAGGVGVTPILSMCNTLIDRKSSREVWIYFGVRNPDDLVMLQNFEYAAGHLKNAKVFICFSGEMPEGVEDGTVADSGIIYKRGRVDCAMLKATMPGNNYGYYICGPEVMMKTLDKDLQAWGVPKDKINWEAFGESAAPAPAAVPAGEALTINYGASGKSVNWQGEKSIRAAAKANRFKEKKIKYACGQGKCGCCHTALKSGEVAYLDVQPAFPGLQEGYCLPCIATPKSSIELDA